MAFNATKQMNIILDLDSTIISSLRPWDDKLPPLESGLIGHDMDGEYMVYERPGLQKFLDFLFANFMVSVWTAASKDYAIFIINNVILKKPGRQLEFFLFNYHGEFSEEVYQGHKDLRLIWDTYPQFDNTNTIIVDDYEAVFAPQMCNSYPMPAFEADSPDAPNDRELEKLMNKLKNIKPGNCPNGELMTDLTLQKALDKIAKGEEEALLEAENESENEESGNENESGNESEGDYDDYEKYGNVDEKEQERIYQLREDEANLSDESIHGDDESIHGYDETEVVPESNNTVVSSVLKEIDDDQLSETLSMTGSVIEESRDVSKLIEQEIMKK